MNLSLRSLVSVSLLLTVVGGCSDSPSNTSATVAATAAPTTVATTTTVAPPTTLPASAVFLRSDGFGPFDFGTPYDRDAFEAGIQLVRGSNDGRSFPLDGGQDYPVIRYHDPGSGEEGDQGESFAYPSAREVCFDDGLDAINGNLCAYFGGPDKDTLTLVGWDYVSAAGSGGLFSSHGVTVNALMSAVPAIPVPEGACFSYSIAKVDAIFVDLVSDSNTSFGDYEADGSFVPASPEPIDARVSRMSAGATFLGESELACIYVAYVLGVGQRP